MGDHDHSELESKIRSLERKIDDLDYECRQDKRELEGEIKQKADKDHSHKTTERR